MLVVQHESFFRRPKKLLLINFENLPPFFASVPERASALGAPPPPPPFAKSAQKGGRNDVVFFVALIGRRGGRRQ